MNVPILGLIYLPKVKQLLEDLNLLSYGINAEHIDAQLEYEDFIQIIEQILKNYKALKQNLKTSTKQLRQKSKKNYQYLTQFLE
jgi:polysaccharide pyruvyl transferase WcaK-like protein